MRAGSCDFHYTRRKQLAVARPLSAARFGLSLDFHPCYTPILFDPGQCAWRRAMSRCMPRICQHMQIQRCRGERLITILP